jgi:hypothetical protein
LVSIGFQPFSCSNYDGYDGDDAGVGAFRAYCGGNDAYRQHNERDYDGT